MGQQADRIRSGAITFQEKLDILAVWVEQDKALWDVLTALRGPDSPSEIGDGLGVKNAALYDQRRKRKYQTTEIIRAKSGLHGGAARFHAGNQVKVPPTEKWDHFDRHVVKAAKALGIEVVTEAEGESPMGILGAALSGSVPTSNAKAAVTVYDLETLEALAQEVSTPSPFAPDAYDYI